MGDLSLYNHNNPAWSLPANLYYEFEKFIEFKVLPHCNRYPWPRSIIIMDNAPIHISEVYLINDNDWWRRIFKIFASKAGVKLEYLPPYSPDFNPVEAVLAELKA